MSRTRIAIFLGFISITIALAFALTKGEDAQLPERVDFNFHIRPILSQNCYLCHGPDSSSREAGLRLDLAETATAPTDSGVHPIYPGDWQQSEIIRRILSDDPDFQMPPPQMKKRLSEREIALLKKWIDQGAEWKPYWAFILPKGESQAPEVASEAIDQFIDQALAEHQLNPGPAAEKATLLRRLSYVLTGLPPSPEEVQTFLDDESPNAYATQVDRLLASPHFGERWARHWMDLVRYAEYLGHEFDFPILGAWQYRDYLIRAFNADVPYDQLVREHLAGDLLTEPRLHHETGQNESQHGPAFLVLGEGKHSPVDIKKEEADRIDNMIDVTTKTFQALTVGCARCHDHKFDPIPTTDYYSLYGIFESTRYSLIPSYSPSWAQAKVDSIQQIKSQIRRLVAQSEAFQSLDKPVTTHTTPKEQATSSRQVLADFRDGSLNAWVSNGLAFQGKNALGEPAWDAKGRLLGLKTGQVSSRLLGPGIQGSLRSPTFKLEKDKLLIRAAGDSAMIRIVIDNFQLIQNPIYGGLQRFLENPEWQDYEFDLSMWKGHKAYIEFLPAWVHGKDGKGHYVTFYPSSWMEAAYVYAFDGEDPGPPSLPLRAETASKQAMNAWQQGKAKPGEVQLINQFLEQTGPLPRTPAIDSLRRAWQGLAERLYQPDYFQGMTEGDAQLSPVFVRGNHLTPSAEQVPHRFFHALSHIAPNFPQQGSGRLALAEAIANPANPLTARVMVNRLWHHVFGRGIVASVDNFGLQGKLPSHPELLDYLALQFVSEQWSIKTLIRHMVLSETFQRSSQVHADAAKLDPQNLYLSHYPVRRLEAEAIRDGLLAVSGRLNRSMFGKPFEIYLTEFVRGRGRPGQSGSLDGEGRRSLYQSIRRNFLPPFMLTFDMPAPFSTFGRRNVSNVPAQALTLMNDPFVQQQADYWALQILGSPLSFEQRIEEVYMRAFSRLPLGREMNAAHAFFQQQAELYGLDAEKWEEDVCLWADFCHSVFMMKEFVYLR